MRRTSTLYRLARLSADIDAAKSGNPKRVGRRIANHAIGRSLNRAGVWRTLWGGKR